MTKKIRNIGFISTRLAGTDGVSLETGKWAGVLERNGFQCFYFAGELDRPSGVSYVSEESHFFHEKIVRVNEQVLNQMTRPEHVSRTVDALKQKIKGSLYDFVTRFGIDVLIPENAVTIPMNIPLGLAITEYIAETGIAAVAHHHDFFWERDRFLKNSTGDYLNTAFPPVLPGVKHVTINSIASKELSFRRGVSSTVIPNVYDFAAPSQEPGQGIINSIRSAAGIGQGDIMFLQPTRIVPRKWIERSIELVSRLKGVPKVLVISHASGDEGDEYREMLEDYGSFLGVKLVFLSNLATGEASWVTLGDIYQASDFVLYPSGYEGFGNAFLESIYFRKPLLVNRYPVFIADIEPLGFDLITIDSIVTGDTVRAVEELLEDSGRIDTMVSRNYETAREYFSLEVLEKKLMAVFSTL